MAEIMCDSSSRICTAPPADNGGVAARLRSSIKSRVELAKIPPVYKIPLWELNCQFGMVTHKHAQPILLQDAIRQQRKIQQANVTVVFAIRQAG